MFQQKRRGIQTRAIQMRVIPFNPRSEIHNGASESRRPQPPPTRERYSREPADPPARRRPPHARRAAAGDLHRARARRLLLLLVVPVRVVVRVPFSASVHGLSAWAFRGPAVNAAAGLVCVCVWGAAPGVVGLTHSIRIQANGLGFQADGVG
jgi:hypothetical protein